MFEHPTKNENTVTIHSHDPELPTVAETVVLSTQKLIKSAKAPFRLISVVATEKRSQNHRIVRVGRAL